MNNKVIGDNGQSRVGTRETGVRAQASVVEPTSKRQKQWMEVGIAFEMPAGQQTDRQILIAQSGLCFGIKHVTGLDHHYGTIQTVMGEGGFWFPHASSSYGHRREHDLLRASFAYFMAAMTDEERDAIVVGL